MTLKELVSLAESKVGEQITDDELSELFENKVLKNEDNLQNPNGPLSRIIFRYENGQEGQSRKFDIKQLEKELKSGYYVYSCITCYDEIWIEHFTDKIEAFNFFGAQNMDSLVYIKILIDTEKGIIAGNRNEGNRLSKQYEQYTKWLQEKYKPGTKIKVINAEDKTLNNAIGTILEYEYPTSLKVYLEGVGVTHLIFGIDTFKIIRKGK